MLCTAPQHDTGEEVVVERERGSRSAKTGFEEQPVLDGRRLSWRDSFLRGRPASERQMLSLIAAERQEREDQNKAIEEQLRHERKERVSTFEELWRRVEEIKVQHMLMEGAGPHSRQPSRQSHGGHGHGPRGKNEEEFIQYSHQLIDFCIAQGTALAELFEALHHYSEGMFKRMPEYSLVQDDIQAFQERISSIRETWTKANEAAVTNLADEFRPQELSTKLVALEAKLENRIQALVGHFETAEEDLQRREEATASLAQKVVDEVAVYNATVKASAAPKVNASGTSTRDGPVVGLALQAMHKKLKVVESRQEAQGKQVRESLAWRADLVKVMLGVPLMEVSAHRTALRCVGLSPEKRLEALKVLEAKEAELEARRATVKERHNVTVEKSDVAWLDKLELEQQQQQQQPSEEPSLWGKVVSLVPPVFE